MAVVHLKAIIRVLKVPNYPDPECVIKSLKFLESLMLSGSLLKRSLRFLKSNCFSPPSRDVHSTFFPDSFGFHTLRVIPSERTVVKSASKWMGFLADGAVSLMSA